MGSKASEFFSFQPAVVFKAGHKQLAVIFSFACCNSSSCQCDTWSTAYPSPWSTAAATSQEFHNDSSSLSVALPLVFSAIVSLRLRVLSDCIYLAVAAATFSPLWRSVLRASEPHQPCFLPEKHNDLRCHWSVCCSNCPKKQPSDLGHTFQSRPFAWSVNVALVVSKEVFVTSFCSEMEQSLFWYKHYPFCLFRLDLQAQVLSGPFLYYFSWLFYCTCRQ